MHLQSAKLRKRLFLLTELVLVGCVQSGTEHVKVILLGWGNHDSTRKRHREALYKGLGMITIVNCSTRV